jgi:hypothetical protein
MSFAAASRALDDIGRPGRIILTIAAFWFWWPVGFAVLAYMAFARRQARGERGPWGQWSFPKSGFGACGRNFSYTAPSGNRAFDDYRTETLRRLEDEQKEFVEYLDRLRQARDKAEFDQFMAERQRPARTDEPNRT